MVEIVEEEDDPFDTAADKRPTSESPGAEKRPTPESQGRKRTLVRRKEPSPKRNRVTTGGDDLEFDMDSLENASIGDLLKKKLIKDILGTSSSDDKKTDEVSKTDATDIRISGSLRVTLGNGTKFTVTLDEDSPSSANVMARHLLRVPNCKPGEFNDYNSQSIYNCLTLVEIWWTKQDGLKKSLPVRTSGLYLTSTMGSARIHDNTLARLHHRTSSLNTKMLLNKNAHLCDQDKVIMMSSNTAKFGAKMEDASDTFELVEAVLNYLACTYMIRCYSYEGIALVRGLHNVRYFFNVCSSEAQQKKLLSGAVDRVLARNRALGSEGEPPLDYTQVVELLKNYYSEQGSSGPEHLLTSGNCYSGTKSVEAAKYQEFLKHQQNPSLGFRPPRNQRGYGGGATPINASGGGQKSGMRDPKPMRSRLDKITGGICRNFNLGVCKTAACRFKHVCNKVFKKTLQNGKQVDWVCGESHEASTCSN